MALSREQRRERVLVRRARYAASGSCETCGSTENLVWDHIDPSTKTRNVSWFINNLASEARTQEEIAKCRVLCSGCNTRRSDRFPAARHIDDILASDKSHAELARRYGVAPVSIRRLRKRHAS